MVYGLSSGITPELQLDYRLKCMNKSSTEAVGSALHKTLHKLKYLQ